MTAALVALALALGQMPQQPQQPAQPQQPQQPATPPTPPTPGSSSQQSTTIVVPPPAGQPPVVIQPREAPVQVAPCPEPKVVYRDRKRRSPVAIVITDAFLGSAAGLAVGAGVGLATADTSQDWREALGWGAVVGFGVGAVAGGIEAYLYEHEERSAAVGLRLHGGRPMLVLHGKF